MISPSHTYTPHLILHSTKERMTTSHGMLIYQNDITPDTLVDMKGDRKILEQVSAMMPNSSLFKLDKEDHTVANLLHMKLHESPYVRIAGYRVPHPTQHRVELRVQTAAYMGPAAVGAQADPASATAVGSGGAVPTPKEALQTAIDSCLVDLETFEQQLRAEADLKNFLVNEE